MKNEKFCFSKGTGLIALVGVLFIGVVLFAQISNTPKSTNTKASEYNKSKNNQIIANINKKAINDGILEHYSHADYVHDRNTNFSMENKPSTSTGTSKECGENKLCKDSRCIVSGDDILCRPSTYGRFSFTFRSRESNTSSINFYDYTVADGHEKELYTFPQNKKETHTYNGVTQTYDYSMHNGVKVIDRDGNIFLPTIYSDSIQQRPDIYMRGFEFSKNLILTSNTDELEMKVACDNKEYETYDKWDWHVIKKLENGKLVTYTVDQDGRKSRVSGYTYFNDGINVCKYLADSPNGKTYTESAKATLVGYIKVTQNYKRGDVIADKPFVYEHTFVMNFIFKDRDYFNPSVTPPSNPTSTITYNTPDTSKCRAMNTSNIAGSSDSSCAVGYFSAFDCRSAYGYYWGTWSTSASFDTDATTSNKLPLNFMANSGSGCKLCPPNDKHASVYAKTISNGCDE